MQILIEKAARRLTLWNCGKAAFTCRIGLGRCPEGPKRQEGDGRTPEGTYQICLIKPAGKYGRSLGLSYPGPEDADRGLKDGRIDEKTWLAIHQACQEHRRPPWGTALGGEIYLHEGGSAADWTQGCIALDSGDMDALFPLRQQIEQVEIRA